MDSNQNSQAVTLLANLPLDTPACITAVNGDGPETRRLMEMGVLPGVMVNVVKTAPFGDPIEVRIRGYSLAMRRSDARSIEVKL